MTHIASILFLLSALLPASFRHTAENRIEQAESLRPFFQRLQENQRPVRIVHLGDSHVRGHVFSTATRQALEAAWGGQATTNQEITYSTTALAKETGQPGLVYHAIGSNGATATSFATESRLAEVEALTPDLILLSFGTNEAHGTYNETSHQEELLALLATLQSHCPQATVMLTTPPGSYLTRRIRRKAKGRTRYTYRRVPTGNTPKVVATQRAFAQEHSLPLWDLYRITGGETYGLRNWTNAGLMKSDRVHYTDEGYTLMGQLLAEAFITTREKQHAN